VHSCQDDDGERHEVVVVREVEEREHDVENYTLNAPELLEPCQFVVFVFVELSNFDEVGLLILDGIEHGVLFNHLTALAIELADNVVNLCNDLERDVVLDDVSDGLRLDQNKGVDHLASKGPNDLEKRDGIGELHVDLSFKLAMVFLGELHHAQSLFELWNEREVEQEGADESSAVQNIVSSFHVLNASAAQPNNNA
jgi:hypothetical protein